jgi:hypothetical protein
MLAFEEMQMDCVIYCNEAVFDINRFLSDTVFPILHHCPVPCISDEFDHVLKAKIGNMAVTPAVDETGTMSVESDYLWPMSQADIALPSIAPNEKHGRIVAEVCGFTNEKYVAQKLWQLEKDVTY